MTQTPTLYQGMLTARSRRLRITGSLLLVAILVMVFYGAFSLMPSVRQAVAAHPEVKVLHPSAPTPDAAPITPQERHNWRAVRTVVIFAYCYWTVCALLIVVTLVVAWLDFREISRNYLRQRRAIWTETADNVKRDTE